MEGAPDRELPEAQGSRDTVASLLAGARHGPAPGREAAIRELRHRFARPVYRALRSIQSTHQDARLLASVFFLLLTRGAGMAPFDPGQSSFRAYLKTLLGRFLGDGPPAAAPSPVGVSLAVPGSLPERAFDDAWRVSLMDRAVGQVRKWYLLRGWVARFRVFEEHDLGRLPDRQGLDRIARSMGIAEKAAAQYLFGVRQEIRAFIRSDLESMTGSREQMEREWASFLEV